MSRRAALIVLDGLGIGAAPDAAEYGDSGSNTLGNTLARVPGLALPNLAALGLGNCAALPGVPPAPAPSAAWGTLCPAGAGKDSTTGHWELCGIVLDRPFPTYPRGFPDRILAAFSEATGRGVLGNRAASGTAILEDLGGAHLASGDWIVYTSADSVFQVAAHEDIIPPGELYRACRLARDLLVPPDDVSRVIARPFAGGPGAWRRTSGRRDFSLPPPSGTLLDRLAASGVSRLGVGKVDDLFAGRGIESSRAATNAAAYGLIREGLATLEAGLLLANVVEFDQAWGHRNDVTGFARGLEELDAAIPGILGRMRRDDLIIFTADHGNDPTTPSTDHSRECVPLLVTGPRVGPRALGRRATFADVGQTLCDFFDVPPVAGGRSFLTEIWHA